MEEVSSEKRMTISNIKLAIHNMYVYVRYIMFVHIKHIMSSHIFIMFFRSRQVRLTGDGRRTCEDKNRPDLDYQLDRIQALLET